MNKNLVSIITPMYNSGKFIKDTIDSVLSQTYKEWEMIIVDDCSTDISPEIVKSYVGSESRIKYFFTGAGRVTALHIRRKKWQIHWEILYRNLLKTK